MPEQNKNQRQVFTTKKRFLNSCEIGIRTRNRNKDFILTRGKSRTSHDTGIRNLEEIQLKEKVFEKEIHTSAGKEGRKNFEKKDPLNFSVCSCVIFLRDL